MFASSPSVAPQKVRRASVEATDTISAHDDAAAGAAAGDHAVEIEKKAAKNAIRLHNAASVSLAAAAKNKEAAAAKGGEGKQADGSQATKSKKKRNKKKGSNGGNGGKGNGGGNKGGGNKGRKNGASQ